MSVLASVLTSVLAAVLGWVARLLPPGQRDWAAAVRAEAAAVPAGRARAGWLAGGVRVAVTQAALSRRCATAVAFAGAAAGTVVLGWAGPASNPVVAVNRADVLIMTAILAGMPRLVRRWLGPARPGRTSALIRAGGYAFILALVLAKTMVERNSYVAGLGGGAGSMAASGEIVFLPVMTLYAAGILAVTARRSLARPGTVGIGAATGAAGAVIGYALGPLGLPLRFTGQWPPVIYDTLLAVGITLAVLAPMAAGLVAVRRELRRPGPGRTSRGRASPGSASADHLPVGDPAQQGAAAGLCAGLSGALVFSALGTASIAALPRHPALIRWASDHLTLSLRLVFAQFSGHSLRAVSMYAGGYLLVLIFVPLLAAGLAGWTAMTVGPRPGQPPGRPPGGGPPPRPAPPCPPAAGLPLPDATAVPELVSPWPVKGAPEAART
jgi:hypothetical protein